MDLTGTTVAVLFGVTQPQVTLAALVLCFVLFYARIAKLLFKVFFLDNTLHKRVLFFFFTLIESSILFISKCYGDLYIGVYIWLWCRFE